ncbi:MAG: glycosyltransferase family 39 protein [Candidatus Saccharibacteria bacterium]|nr:glycosyltransferase family 39 protein [Candidatus Saccharibacteria bacterium]
MRMFRKIFREVKEWWGENWTGVAKLIMVVFWFLGILMRLGVAIEVKMPAWNYDMGGPDGYGHMGYMWRIYQTGRLPQWNYTQFYHPPLHYLIGAGVLKISSIFTQDAELMQNLLKIMPFIWSVLILVVAWRMFGEVGMRKRMKYVAMTVMLFQTGLIRMACSVNNDSLSILLILYSLLWLIRWWKNPSVKLAGVLGLFTGLAVMTKASGMVLFLVEFLALMVKFLERKDKKRIWRNYAKMALVFMLISLPIGLWYPVRNYMKFGQELTYVLDLGNVEKNVIDRPVSGPERGFMTKLEEEGARATIFWIKNHENTLEHSLFERVVPPGMEQLLIGRRRVDASRDYYNLYASVILTSLYEDLGVSEEKYGEVVISALSVIVMVWASVILAGVMTRGLVRVLSGIRAERVEFEMIMFIYMVILIFGYVMANLRLPMGCTTSFRYLMPIMVASLTVTGMEEKMARGRIYRRAIYLGLLLMVVAYGLADLAIMAG